eukprot:205235-Pelagomonas_calceolata.AAC.8
MGSCVHALLQVDSLTCRRSLRWRCPTAGCVHACSPARHGLHHGHAGSPFMPTPCLCLQLCMPPSCLCLQLCMPTPRSCLQPCMPTPCSCSQPFYANTVLVFAALHAYTTFMLTALHAYTMLMLAALHAMAYIKCLLSGKSALHFGPDGTRTKKDDVQAAVQDQVVKLATEEGLVTPYTSAVGVLLQADPKDPTKTQQMEVSSVAAVHTRGLQWWPTARDSG